jgi:hypothetical protein
LAVDPTTLGSEEHRHRAADVVGRPTRPSAVCPVIIWFTSASSRTIPPPKSVAMAPGAIVLTAMRRAPSSFTI